MRQFKLSATEGESSDDCQFVASTGEETVGGGGERSGTDYTGGQYCSRQETREGKEGIFLFERACFKKELMCIGKSKIMTD